MKRIARRIITAAVNATTKLLTRFATNSAALTTVAQYLRARGVNDDWITRWGSAFGRHAAKTYRASTGRNPYTTWEFDTRGKLRRHHAYPGDAALDAAWTHYTGHPTARLGEAINQHTHA